MKAERGGAALERGDAAPALLLLVTLLTLVDEGFAAVVGSGLAFCYGGIRHARATQPTKLTHSIPSPPGICRSFDTKQAAPV